MPSELKRATITIHINSSLDYLWITIQISKLFITNPLQSFSLAEPGMSKQNTVSETRRNPTEDSSNVIGISKLLSPMSGIQPPFRVNRVSQHPTAVSVTGGQDIRLTEEIHQLRLVVYPIIYREMNFTSQVVQDFFHQQYLQPFFWWHCHSKIYVPSAPWWFVNCQSLAGWDYGGGLLCNTGRYSSKNWTDSFSEVDAKTHR